MQYKTTKRNDRNLTILSMLRSERSLSKMEVKLLEEKLEWVANWNCLDRKETELFDALQYERKRLEEITLITEAFEAVISKDIPKHIKDERSI